jgi:hypothetical protein
MRLKLLQRKVGGQQHELFRWRRFVPRLRHTEGEVGGIAVQGDVHTAAQVGGILNLLDPTTLTIAHTFNITNLITTAAPTDPVPTANPNSYFGDSHYGAAGPIPVPFASMNYSSAANGVLVTYEGDPLTSNPTNGSHAYWVSGFGSEDAR